MIHMRQDSKDIQYVVGTKECVNNMQKVPALQPFSDSVILFLDALSRNLQSSANKEFSDVASFGFWCRKAALLIEKKRYTDKIGRLGLGVVFHSTPSNVAVNFAFSFAAGLLAGNCNIVRLPRRNFQQVDIICSAINEVLKEHVKMQPYIVMVRYDSSKDISDFFSSLANARIIWGGDATIERMRQSPIPPRSRDICFADRYSLLVMNADVLLAEASLEQVARAFYNDTYQTDQNACTSPIFIIWTGKEKSKGKQVFWEAVGKLKARYDMAVSQVVDKLTAFYLLSAQLPVELVPMNDNFITRVVVSKMDAAFIRFKAAGGFFFEYDTDNLNELLPLLGVKCQTVTYYGLDRFLIEDVVRTSGCRGVDRIVPIGQSMAFSLRWDGYDLIYELSRIIS